MKAFIQHKDKAGNKMVLLAQVRFTDLKDSVVFTCKSTQNRLGKGKEILAQESYDYYQRRIDAKRISQIGTFIIDSILDEQKGKILATLFPSSMILALSDEENEIEIIDELADVTFKNNIFIVDGQHRMMAMLKEYEYLNDGKNKHNLYPEQLSYVKEYIENYKFNCTILVNYDLWEQGQIFINVNFKQKPVNKSLYYEVFGSEYREDESDWNRNKIYIAHRMAIALNNTEYSPFYQNVKMLGTGKGYISQAFIVESLLQHFSINGMWFLDTERLVNIEQYISCYTTELLSFFVAIHRLFTNYWPKEDASKGTLICKTTGFGAWCRLMGDIHDEEDERMAYEIKNSASTNKPCEYYIEHVKSVLTPLVSKAEMLFGHKSEYAQSSGKATENKLYKRILSELSKANIKSTLKDKDINEDKLFDIIQEYLWNKPIDDLDCLAHHYEVEEIDNFEVLSIEEHDGSNKIECSFNINVSLYLDNEDDNGYYMTFPAKFVGIFDNKGQDIELDEKTVSISVDIREYYE